MPERVEFDGCQVVEKLRSGPVTDLYHAIQKPLGRPVLIKALSSSILPSSPFAASLEREARLLAELHHPGVLAVHDFVRRDERMWLVLEYVEGLSLEELIERVGKLNPPVATAIALEIARALSHAHGFGIVHRDVQPRNVLIGFSGNLKLINFTVAVDERMPTAPELLDGSAGFSGPSYMSPEQILGEASDPRSDLFSLGVVLYEMLSGRRPFDAPDQGTTTQRIRHESPEPLTRSVDHLPHALDRAVRRCLEKLPSDRFASADELSLILEQILADADQGSARSVISQALAEASIADEAPKSLARPTRPTAPKPEPDSLRPALAGLVLCSVLAVLGGGAIQALEWKRSEGTPRTSPAIEVSPSIAGYLRVVAEPWANVIVDGQKVDTTPFARSIVLAPGTHYVRLEHPNAPTERRTIHLVPGETVLLDVKMAVEHAPVPDAGIVDASEAEASP